MQMVLTEGYRGFALVLDLTIDRIVVPVAILVALSVGAGVGLSVADGLTPVVDPAYQL